MSESVSATWPSKRAIELFYIKGRLGWKGLRAAEFLEEGPFLITGTDFDGSKVDWNRSFHVSDARFLESPEIIVQPSDILITKDGTIGKVAFIDHIPFPGKASLNSHLFLVRGRTKLLDQRFAFYIFLSYLFMRYVEAKQTGSTRIGLPQRVFERFEVPVPPMEQQRRIAEILSTLDETIEQTEALIAKYQQIKAGLMHDLFTRGVTPDGKLRRTRAEAPELYKESSLGWIPKEWEVESLSTIAESLIDGPFGSNLKTEHYVQEPGVRVVRLQNVQEGAYNDADRAFVSQQHADYLSRNKVNPGDVLIAALGEDNYPPGRACCYPEGLPPAINKADCYRLRCGPKCARNAYVMQFLNTVAARNQVRRFEQGVTRRRTNLGNFRRVKVALPDSDEQEQVIHLLKIASSQVESGETVVEKLRQQKHGLMQDLLTGRVRVKVDGE